MTDYDGPWKEALTEFFQPFLALCFPEIDAEVDWSRGYESLDQELRPLVRNSAWRCQWVDHLVKVWFRRQREGGLIHVEVQTSRESNFARRMFTYNHRLCDKYRRKVLSLAVLGDDNPRWRPDRFGYSRWGSSTEIRFPVVKLLDYAEQWETLEQSRNPFAMVIMAHLLTLQTRHDPQARYSGKVELVKKLYDRARADG